MAQRTSATQQTPANLAPLIAAAAVVGAVVATFFQLPGAVIAAVGLAVSGFFFNAPPPLNAKDPQPDKVQQQQRRWSEMRWRTLVPSGDWLLNQPSELPQFRQSGRAGFEKLSTKLPAKLRPLFGLIGEVFGLVGWFILPSRFVGMVALGVGFAALTLPSNLVAIANFVPKEAIGIDLAWVNGIYAYGIVMAADAVIRRSAAVSDPSPGVPISTLTERARSGDGGAWRAFIGFGFLGLAIAAGALLTILSLSASYLFVPPWLFGLGLGLAAAGGALHGVARKAALEPWRDQVKARAEWVTRWEAMKYPEVTMVSHQRVGAFVVDTFDSPPSLGSKSAINLYNTVVPYLAGGGDMNVAMLTVPALDSQGQPSPGTAHATQFRVVVAPADAQLNALDPNVDLEELKLAAEVGAFYAAQEWHDTVPVLLDVAPAHTPDSQAAVWQTQWTAPLQSPGTVAWHLGVDPESGAFAEGTTAFFGDFESATLQDRTLPARMERAAYTARWSQRWSDALKMGEKQPVLQYGAIKRERLAPNIELSYEPFLTLQGISPMRYFYKEMREKLATTLKAAPFVTVIGLTGAIAASAGHLGDGVRHPQGFAVVHSPTPIPGNPAEIASPGPRAREVAKWVLGGLINKAFEDAKLPYPEVIKAEALTRPQSQGHVWKVHLRLYDGVTTATLKLNAVKLAMGLGGVRWLRFEESEVGCYMVMGALPHAEGVKFANPKALAYCDKLDWAQAFQDAGVRSVADGSSPLMVENAPHETNPKITRMVFTMPQGLNLGKVIEATQKLRSATANDYVDIRPYATPDKFVVLASEVNPIPFPALLDWEESADVDGKGSHAIPFAYTTDGSTVSLDWMKDFHMMVLGGSGSGKSSFMQVLTVGAILRNCDLFVMDPTKGATDFEFATPWIRGFAREGQHLGAGELTQLIGMEMNERKRLNGQYGVGNYRDLPDEVRPRHMFVIIDEFQSLIKEVSKGNLKAPDTTDEVELALFEQRKNINDGVRKLAMWVGKFGREARAVGITVVLAGQGIKAAELEAVGLQGMKTNFSRVALGRMTQGDMASAFKDVTTLPNLGTEVPQGRGIFEGTSGEPLIIQSWYEPGGQPEMQRKLLELVPPIPDERRIDVGQLEDRVKSAAPKAFGAVVDEFEVEDEDDDEIILSADDLGLDLGDLSFDDDFSFDDPPPAPFVDHPVAPGDQFTLEEPPTDVPLVEDAVPEDEATEPVADPSSQLLFHEGQFIDTPFGLEGRIVIGRDIVFGVNAPTGDGSLTGWPEGDALNGLLFANPRITEVVWDDPLLDELDDIGIPREDIARDICRRHDTGLLTSEPAPEPEPVPVHSPGPEPEPTPAPSPLAEKDLTPALFEMDDFPEPVFERPQPKVPDLSEADDLFAPRKVNVPDSPDIGF